MPKPYGEWCYRSGDFYRLDDRTGFKVRASRQIKEWENLIVAREVYETRHPQDFVKGVWDDQTVPEPRPRPTSDIFIGTVQIPALNGYTTEDLSALYTAEDGLSVYVTES